LGRLDLGRDRPILGLGVEFDFGLARRRLELLGLRFASVLVFARPIRMNPRAFGDQGFNEGRSAHVVGFRRRLGVLLGGLRGTFPCDQCPFRRRRFVRRWAGLRFGAKVDDAAVFRHHLGELHGLSAVANRVRRRLRIKLVVSVASFIGGCGLNRSRVVLGNDLANGCEDFLHRRLVVALRFAHEIGIRWLQSRRGPTGSCARLISPGFMVTHARSADAPLARCRDSDSATGCSLVVLIPNVNALDP
jgi:hypothetical protein